MDKCTSIAELQRAGVTIRAGEAVAVVQKLINDRPPGPPQPPFGPPSPDTVVVDEHGDVRCRRSDVRPAVSEMAILLEAMLPPGTRLPGALRYMIERGLLNVEAPPFGSIEEFSTALERFERNDRGQVIRELVARARAVADGDAQASVIPFNHARSAVRFKTERRRPMPAALAADLRRELRRADLERYARQAASTIPDLRGALLKHRRPIGALAAGLAAGVLLIASGELMQVGAVAESSTPLPSVNAPMPSIPEPATAFPPPAGFFDRRAPAATSFTPVLRRASYPGAERASRSASTRRPPASREAQAERGKQRTAGQGVLGRLRLQWMRSLFTYRRDL
jgi:hypothetical protein